MAFFVLSSVQFSRSVVSVQTLCNPMDCSLSGLSIHRILQAKVLEWVAISFSRGSSQPRDWTWVSCIADSRFTVWATDLNQIPYDYTVEVRNRFKRLDLTESWWTMDGGLWHCTGDRDQDHPHGKEMQKSKMAVWRGLTNSCEKKGSKKQKRKGQIYPFECRVPKNSKES